MTDWLYTAETGLSDGTDLTAANSDDGTAGLALTTTKVGGGTIKFRATNALRGGLSVECAGTTSADQARCNFPGIFSSLNLVVDSSFYTPNMPSTDMKFIEFRSASGGVTSVGIKSTGKLMIYNTGFTILWTSTASVNTATTGWRVGIRVVPDTSTTGYVELAYYALRTDTTPTETHTISNGDFGTAAINDMRIGKITSAPTWAAHLWDDVQISDTRTSLFGAPVSDDTVSAGADQTGVEPWTTVTLTATSSSGSATWSHVSGPNPTITGSDPLIRTVRYVPTDFTTPTSVYQATNGTATDQMSVSYLAATEGRVVSVGPVVEEPIRIVRKSS